MTVNTKIFTDLQSINPSAIIELYKLELLEGVNYATGNPLNIDTVYRL